jgi:SpoVK/Ycf46/Vps4 family AAA+-type ATPase
MDNYREIFSQLNLTDCFDHNAFLNAGKLYFKLFQNIPAVNWIYNIDRLKAFDYIQKEYAGTIRKVLSESGYCHKHKKQEVENGLIILDNERIIKLGYSAVSIFTANSDTAFAVELSEKLKRFKEKTKKRTFEMNLITMGKSSFDVTSTEVKRTNLDLSLHYEDDFRDVDQIIRKRLNKKKDKGIVLLHGLPGTGKTTYLRYLIGKINKRVLFVSPNLAQRITDPEFMQLLLENQDSVLIIEDAENVVMDRNESGGSGVSNLLNLSDGLLSDCLNIQVVCSFNTPLQNIDTALLRKGRLIARYEFDKLSVRKAQALSDHIGKRTVITEPMSVSEVYNQEEMTFVKAKKKIGFVVAA